MLINIQVKNGNGETSKCLKAYLYAFLSISLFFHFYCLFQNRSIPFVQILAAWVIGSHPVTPMIGDVKIAGLAKRLVFIKPFISSVRTTRGINGGCSGA